MARNRRSRLTNLYGWFTTGAVLLGGAGVSGWAKPDLPFVGPFVQQSLAKLNLPATSVGKKSAGPTTAATAGAPAPAAREAGSSPAEVAKAPASPANRTAQGHSPLGPSAAKKKAKKSPESPRVAGYAPDDPAANAGPNPATAAASPSAADAATTSVATIPDSATPVRESPEAPAPNVTPAAETRGTPLPAASRTGGAKQPAASPSPTGTITIATYNIQVFGVSKLQQPQVREVLAQVVRQFDLVAIQEVRSKDDSVIPEFLRTVNADGHRYDFVIGPRLGRTNSKEQYAFVFNTERIEVDPSSVVTLDDPNDLLHREPLAARFRARVNPPEAGFTFWLVDIHTDPDEVAQEVDVLVDVLQVMARANPGEDDIILLGDLNADETKFGRLAQIPDVTWVVPKGVPTNTRGTQTYDNLLFLEHRTAEFTGRWGVVNMRKAFNLSLDDALKVSDHLPVWAEFQATEVLTPNTAQRARLPAR